MMPRAAMMVAPPPISSARQRIWQQCRPLTTNGPILPSMSLREEAALAKIRGSPGVVMFEEVLEAIDSSFAFTPTSFTVGDVTNESGTNIGSCKVLAWAQARGLTKEEVLACFGQHYRELDPAGQSHPNLRQVIEHGLERVKFETMPLGPNPHRAEELAQGITKVRALSCCLRSCAPCRCVDSACLG